MPACIDENVKAVNGLFCGHHRAVAANIQRIVVAQGRHADDASLAKRKQSADRLRRDRRIVVDKHAGQPVFEALSVLIAKMGNNLLNDLMQPKDGIAPGDGAPFAFVPFNFIEVLFRPAKRTVLLTILKPGVTQAVGVVALQRKFLAPCRVGTLKLFHHQGKNAVKQAIRSFGYLAFNHGCG